MLLLSIAAVLVHTAVVASGVAYFIADHAASDPDRAVVATMMMLSIVFIVSQAAGWAWFDFQWPDAVSLHYGFSMALGTLHTVVIRSSLHKGHTCPHQPKP